MMKKSVKYFLTAVLCLSVLLVQVAIAPITVKAAAFAYGADVSWLSQMEARGVKFYDDNGVQKDCLQILKEHGVDSIRLRVWVNPSTDPYSGHCSKDETVAMAKRCASMGFRIMIDFHYSDSWADPGKQYKPAAWSSHGVSQLVTDVYNHTYDVLSALKTNGVTPEWVQVGNETNDGMLWEDGRASKSMSNFVTLVNSGYDAVKAVFSSAKVIVHISNGYDNSLFRWIFDGLKNNGGKYDVIGMSLYPSTSDWSTKNSQCLTNMNDMVSRYGKEVMICEVGLDYTAAQAGKDMLTDLISKAKSVSGGKGLGVFYWEPECYNWAGYNLGAWNTNGRPTIAMDAFIHSGGTTPTPTPVLSTATPTPTPSTATPTPTPATATATPTPSTATPTPSTATPTPTPIPTTGTPLPGGIKVQFFNGNTAATTNTIYPNFKVLNTGTAAINLSDVKVRYYFTNDGTQANSFACDYSTVGAGNVTGSFTSISKTNADRYLEVGFTSAAGTLDAGVGTEVKGRVWKSDWSNFTQTNDYSFNATATNYVDSITVTGYIAGTLKWGVEP